MTDFNQSMYSYMINRTSCLNSSNKMISFFGAKIRRSQFIKEVDKVGSFLQNKGVKKGDNVILSLGNIPNAIICFYAINRIGAIANVVHPLITSNVLSKMCKEMNPKCLILFDEFHKRYDFINEYPGIVIFCSALDYLPRLYKPFYSLYIAKRVLGLSYANNVYKYSKIKGGNIIDIDVAGEDVAIYMHSSGTTGEPKTACLSNDAYNHLADNLVATIYKQNNKDDKCGMLMALPIFHTFGLGVCMHTSLCCGAQAVLMPKFNANYAALLVLLNPITMISGVPNMFRKMADSPFFRGPHLKKIENCFCGGDKLPVDVKNKFESACRKSGGNLIIEEGYGLTEAGVCILNVKDSRVDNSIGIPIQGNDVAIMNDKKELLKNNEVGNIYISSNSAMKCYYNDPKGTESVFYVDDSGKKWISTGDVGYMDNTRHVFFTDRKKRLIKISGMNVFPQEIENIVNTIDGIAMSCAVQSQIDGKTIIKLYIEMEKGISYSKVFEQEIISRISKTLMKYSIPKCIEVIDKMPLTMIGKVDFNKIKG